VRRASSLFPRCVSSLGFRALFSSRCINKALETVDAGAGVKHKHRHQAQRRTASTVSCYSELLGPTVSCVHRVLHSKQPGR
jgi:hypothetical protein